ncbi:MAG: DUF4271 domain-containing protein [Bacteroidales bacterium]|nr:DUF4271 domain-containing protein [Bacteroidales bacterium]
MISQNQGLPLAEDILRSEWIFILLIFPVLIYLFVSLNEKYSLVRIIKIVFSNKFAQTAYRNSSPGIEIFQLMLGLISLISISTFILFTELHFEITFYNLGPGLLWLFNLLLVSLAIVLRYIVISAIGSVTRTKDTFREYFFNISQDYKLIGIILMLLNFFISYLVSIPDKYIIFLSFLIISVIFLIRIIRLVYIFLIRRFSLFYLILYLCALEILPALIFIRYLSGQEQ